MRLKVVRDLLKLENHPEICDFKLLDIPLWIFYRINIFYYVILTTFGLANPHVERKLKSLSPKEKFSYLLKTVLINPFVRRKQCRVLAIGYGINNNPENGYFYNRLHDPFYEILGEKFFLLETSDKFRYHTPRFCKNLAYFELTEIITKKFRKYVKINSNEVCNVAKIFADYIVDKFKEYFDIDISMFVYDLVSNIKMVVKQFKIRKFIYELILNNLKPKLLIIDNAHDGGFGGNVELIRICKEKNIIVAEFQHGFISNDHLTYNYGKGVKQCLADFLPDYMLFWGKYWADGADIPGKKIVIGLPYISKKFNQLSDRRKEIFILLVSGGKVPEDYVSLAKLLRKAFPGKRMVFRPHPSERPAVKERYHEIINTGWEIDMENIYSSLSASENCISLELSTVLFEAVLFCNKVLLVRNRANEFCQLYNLPFKIVNNSDELIDSLNANCLNSNSFNKEELFSSKWEENFHNFLEEIGVL